MSTVVHKLFVVLILLCLFGLLGARQQSENDTSPVPGWVVVQRDSSGDDTQTIQAAIDQVDRGTGDPHTVIKCLFLALDTGKTGEKSWMDVEDPRMEGVEKHRR